MTTVVSGAIYEARVRRQMRVHDLRGTLVTVHLANGKSEAWISDRTGHKSSAMINRYKRTARTFAELPTGDLERSTLRSPSSRRRATHHGLPTNVSN